MATDAFCNKVADNYRAAMSRLMIAPDDATYNLIRIPKYALVTDVFIQIVSAFTVDASVTVGWSGNGETAVTNGFIDAEDADPTVLGLKRAANTTLVTFSGKYFNTSGGAITATVLDNNGAVGNFRVFAIYSVIHP